MSQEEIPGDFAIEPLESFNRHRADHPGANVLLMLGDALIQDARGDKIALRTVAMLYAYGHWSMAGLPLRKIASRFDICHVQLWREVRKMRVKLGSLHDVVTKVQRKRAESVTEDQG